MIVILASSLILSMTAGPDTRPARTRGIETAALKKKWVELPQQIQVEADYSPRVGRVAEPSPEPFVPVRYLSPEQRAEPIIVPPTPLIVYINDQPADEQTSSSGSGVPSESTAVYSSAAPTPQAADTSYLTSTPTTRSVESKEVVAAGSATGSKAIPSY